METSDNEGEIAMIEVKEYNTSAEKLIQNFIDEILASKGSYKMKGEGGFIVVTFGHSPAEPWKIERNFFKNNLLPALKEALGTNAERKIWNGTTEQKIITIN